jgi:hypothetical protein
MFPNFTRFSLYGKWSKKAKTGYDLHLKEHALEYLELSIEYVRKYMAKNHSNKHFLLKIVKLSS